MSGSIFGRLEGINRVRATEYVLLFLTIASFIMAIILAANKENGLDSTMAFCASFIGLVAYVLYKSGWHQVTSIVVLLIPFLLAFSFDERDLTIDAPEGILIAGLIATLVAERAYYVFASAGLLLALIVIRTGGHGAYINAEFLIVYAFEVSCLFLIRYVLENIEKRSEDSSTLLNKIIDEMREGFQIIGYDWRYIYVNQAAATQGKSNPITLMGRTMMSAYPGIEKTELFTRLQKCMEERTPDVMENEFTFPDGSKGWFELRIDPVEQGIVIFSSDIAGKKQLDAAQSDFMTLASHHLRTPLTEIRNSNELLLEGDLGKLPKLAEKYVRESQSAAEVAIDLTSKLLNIARIEAGSLAVSSETVSLFEVVSSVIQKRHKQIETKKLKVDIGIAAHEIIETDHSILLSIIDVLIANAIVYNLDNGSINILGTKQDNKVRLTVRDTGLGIPAIEQARLFTRFYRGSNVEQLGPLGHGLGLYFAKQGIELLGGSISFSSQEGKGSEFTLELPLKIAESKLGEPLAE